MDNRHLMMKPHLTNMPFMDEFSPMEQISENNYEKSGDPVRPTGENKNFFSGRTERECINI